MARSKPIYSYYTGQNFHEKFTIFCPIDAKIFLIQQEHNLIVIYFGGDDVMTEFGRMI